MAGATTEADAQAPQPDAAAGRYFSLTADAGVMAVLQSVADNRMRVLVGTGPDDLTPAPIAVIPGSKLEPPALHAGTDEQGQPVLVYRRCSGTAAVACDLYRYDVTAKTEQRIRGIRRGGRSEIEGVMSGGALLYSALEGEKRASGIWYRPAGSTTQRRISLYHGWSLALRGKRIAYVLSDGGKEAGEEPCDNSTVVQRSTSGGPAKVIARSCNYEWGYPVASEYLAPTFYGDHLFFSEYRTGGGVVFRAKLKTGKVEYASYRQQSLFGYLPTGANTGLAAVIADDDPTREDGYPTPNRVEAIGGLSWKPRKHPIVKQPAAWLTPEVLR